MSQQKTFVQIKTSHNTNWDKDNWIAELKKWAGAEKVWSCSGTWDWMVKLSSNQTKDWKKVQEQVAWLRSQPWVADTNTWWAEEEM